MNSPFLCSLPFQPLQAAIQDSRSICRIALQALAERLGRHEHLGIRICKRGEESEHAVRGLQEIELGADDARVRFLAKCQATAAAEQGNSDTCLGVHVLPARQACEKAFSVARHKLGRQLDDVQIEGGDAVRQRDSVLLLHKARQR